MKHDGDIEAIGAATNAIQKILSGQISAKRTLTTGTTNVSEPVARLIDSINTMQDQYRESLQFILALSKGDLEQLPPKNNQLVGYFKQLHADLLHLRWQTQEIARGDYEQQVSFMGDFGVSFNKMIDSLKQKQALEDELKEREKNLRDTTAELQKAIELKDKLFSIIAHDLRGPIGNTGSLIKMILNQEISEPAEVQRTLRMLYSSSESTYVLLENLLAWSESRSKELPYYPERSPIKPIFTDTIELFSSALEVKSLRISVKVDPGIEALFDAAMLRTIIRNLVNNSIKFTPNGGTIILSAHAIDKEVEVSVSDTGIGMSPEILSSLFSTATTTVRSGTNHEKGHGLGLTLCYEMVHRHNSQLNVVSTEGKGTTFSFRLVH